MLFDPQYNHEFHLNCLRQYKSTDCPVCRYFIVPDAKTSSICLQCGLSDDLWLCLICGFVDCGRYLNKHAVEHFENTNHTFAKQMDSERVWDYARDQFVHRLIQNKGDGKVVEYTVEAPFTIAEDDPSGDSVTLNGHVSVTADEKLDSIQTEYSYLINSEWQKQRAYYEEKLKLMEIEAKKKETQLEGRLKGVMDEKKGKDRVYFGAVKLMKFQCPFTLGSPYDTAYLVFFKSSQVFAKRGFASVKKINGC